MIFFKFLFWFTFLPWIFFSLKAPFVMWFDVEIRFGFLGLIAYVVAWVFGFWILIPLSFFLGFIHSWKWVFTND